MNPDKRNLIDDLLENSDAQMRRAATLSVGGRVLRRKRWRRTAIRIGGPLMLVLVGTLFACLQFFPRHEPKHPVAATKPVVTYLTDEQLLALFPNTPVGLATVDHRKVLIFPNASDREKFVGQF
ncbi:MAG TPA: hypothetical protein VFB72_17845 [Verrucomicrobiae bacterium]|nr:hypothetical protein [Verrucomicrobiae bacterium]